MSTVKGNILLYSVNNFDKYNCRSDLRTPTWLKLHHTILSDPKLALFTPSERMIWVSILVLRSESNKKYFEINCRYLTKVLNSRTDTIAKTVIKLCSLGLLEMKERHDSDTIATDLVHDSDGLSTENTQIATNGTKQKQDVKDEICIRSVPRQEKRREEKRGTEETPISHCVELSCNEQQNGDEKMNTGQEMTRIANKWDAIPNVRKSGIVSDFKLQTLLQNAIESGVDLDEICEAQRKFGEKGTTLNGLLNPNADFALKKLLKSLLDANGGEAEIGSIHVDGKPNTYDDIYPGGLRE